VQKITFTASSRREVQLLSITVSSEDPIIVNDNIQLSYFSLQLDCDSYISSVLQRDLHYDDDDDDSTGSSRGSGASPASLVHTPDLSPGIDSASLQEEINSLIHRCNALALALLDHPPAATPSPYYSSYDRSAVLAVTAVVTLPSPSYSNGNSSSSTPTVSSTSGIHFEVQFLTRQLRQQDSFPLLQVHRSHVVTLNRKQQLCSVVVTRVTSDSNLFHGSFRMGYKGVYTGDISIDADPVLVTSQLTSLGVFNSYDLQVMRRELSSPSLELLSIEYEVKVMNANNWQLADQALRIRR
jgi:hypothetical protein